MLVKTEGVVLRTRDYGESNKIVVLFTRERGKLPAMARGAKKPKSRLGAATQPFTWGQFLYFAGSGMATLSQADIIKSHYPLRSDLFLTAYAAYLAELLDKMTEEKEPSPVLYDLFLSTLNHLEEGVDPDILCRIFELKVLETAGYRPRLNGCLFCSGVKGPLAFSITLGGILCHDCASRDPKAIPLSPASARILSQLQRITPDRLGQVQIKEETKSQLEQVIRRFLEEYTELKLKSRAFLDRLKKDWESS
ncbi:DNA repair protein RecO [Salinithrix halophila]|uniref:DNA repair protein RecO n=1 Tax=Salinithrix halophila TaxID=1485204 RepID=A0ABV8JEG3_9BACL